MDRFETSSDALEHSVRRLVAAIDALELAAERRMRHDKQRANAQEEYALMQDDRSRLAVELDAALDRSRALEAANIEAGARLARATHTIVEVIGRMDPAGD
jgi:Domain of unknown function (DUF4164)